MKLIWAIQREKNNIVYLRSVPKNSFINSYTCLELTDSEFEEFITIPGWANIPEGGYSNTFADKIKSRFFSLAKSKGVTSNGDYTKKIISSVIGTSCLLRTADKRKIWIARRKQGSTQNETRINRVCIDNNCREDFFNDIRGNRLNRFYLVDADKELFQKWSKYMDKEYMRQINDPN